MKREVLKKVLELFRDGHLTEERTIETIMESMASNPGMKRGDVDMSDPVRALVAKQLDAKGLNMKEVCVTDRSQSFLFAAISDATQFREICPRRSGPN